VNYRYNMRTFIAVAYPPHGCSKLYCWLMDYNVGHIALPDRETLAPHHNAHTDTDGLRNVYLLAVPSHFMRSGNDCHI